MRNFMRDHHPAKRRAISAVGAMAALLLNCHQSAANFARNTIKPLHFQVTKLAIIEFLNPAQIQPFNSMDGPFTLYLFQAAINGSVVIAVRDNCSEKDCATMIANLSTPDLASASVIDHCGSELMLTVGIPGKTKFGWAQGYISATCAGGRRVLVPTSEEGFSDYVEK